MSASLVNLNDALTSFLSSGESLMEVEKVVACSLDHHHVVEEIIRSKRYDALPLFLPLLLCDRYGHYDERFAKVYAQALLDEDEQTIKQLACLGESINFRKVSFWYGALTIVPKDLEQIKHKVSSWVDYLDGLISADNLELFLAHQGTAFSSSFRTTASRYCARKVMDHLGYASENRKVYASEALSANNKETIIHLFSRHLSTRVGEWLIIGTRLHSEIKYELLFGNGEDASFVRWLLEEKYYCPTEDDWAELKDEREKLYTALQADV